ncbi:BHH_G0008970.mRNA.1.CDS.1 [Saccharomyces cerevisiae]|nr:BHH_G0008970.mRNA.1.CDS.1 [Saccharomyces cerevisiae]CAI7068313.1 BHH_G0008970.mRNA.1.CDS.1 [Saccharomyces cerevisiae]
MSEGTVKENNNEEFNAYHTLTTEEAAEFIGTSLTEGLTQDESLRRLKAVGENTLGDDTKIDYKAMVLHQVGDTIPADLRLIETKNFDTDESLLTGESLPVSKDANLVFGKEEETSVGDRLNLAFSSSAVVKGRAKGIVIKTALNSEIGKIAKSLQGDSGLISRDPSKSWLQNTWISTKKVTGAFLGTNVGTPLHRKLSKLAVLLFWIAVLFAIIVMASQSLT